MSSKTTKEIANHEAQKRSYVDAIICKLQYSGIRVNSHDLGQEKRRQERPINMPNDQLLHVGYPADYLNVK